ncbi:MAG: HAMP domain-containing protein [Treponema sp.]|jgi:adenylate cyclase|nr:HAMP domain-containing protein [Treponema sp.]
MSAKKRRRGSGVKYSIGARLITIVICIVLLSLGTITVFSSLDHDRLRISAEENNLEINRRLAAEAELAFVNVRSNSRMFIMAAAAPVEMFFEDNPKIAALFYILPENNEQMFINKQYFTLHKTNEALAETYLRNKKDELSRAARGETFILNASPNFAHPCLAMFFPCQGGAGGVLFSSESLNLGYNQQLNSIANYSQMINADGDVLIQSDAAPPQADVASVDANALANAQIPGVIKTGIEYLINAWKFLNEKFFFALDSAVGFPAAQSSGANSGAIRQFTASTKINSAGVTVITSIGYDEVFREITAVTRRNICITIAVLFFAVFSIWLYSRTISIPLRALNSAVRQIENGTFEHRPRIMYRDEVGLLTSGFRRMCGALQVFGRFSNKEAAVKTIRGKIKPGGQFKHGVILFSGIHEFAARRDGFSKTFGKEAPDKIIEWLNCFFNQAIDCVGKTNGITDKIFGITLMAHWGSDFSTDISEDEPESTPRKDAFNSIKAALMMRKEIYFENKGRKEGDPVNPPIKYGCGISSGTVTAGLLGGDKRTEYTVFGDPVNFAREIGVLTEKFGVDILISENTWNMVGDKFLTEEMPYMPVNGIPVKTYAIVNFFGEEKGPQSLSEVRELLGIKATSSYR